MIRYFATVMLLVIVVLPTFAKEGMWIPMLLEKYNIKDMQQRGFELTAEDIYSINHASMKDAVVIFGGGCTGGLISEDGLLITNHHCGYSAIQKHSSVSHDYLTNGFWAMSRDEELVNPDLTVTFLKRMEDVTKEVLSGVEPSMSVKEREIIIKANIDSIETAAVKSTNYEAQVESFYYGNQYFLFINEVFYDVRLVGAAPSSIGKFGGDTDNWMWPRHTGDFTLFRIYANADNKPAKYASDNVPYKPSYYFPISLKGVKEGDFTMVLGYPGSTLQYVPSYHIKMLTEIVYPKLIQLRDIKLDVMKKYIESDRAVRIQYAAKNASVSNSWKRWRGEIKGLQKFDAIKQKEISEDAFLKWVSKSADRQHKYGSLLDEYALLYQRFAKYRLGRDYLLELFGRSGLEAIRLAGSFDYLAMLVSDQENNYEIISKEKEKLKNDVKKHFKDYFLPIDRDIAKILIEKLSNDLPEDFLPSFYATIDDEFKGDKNAFVEHLYNNSIFTSLESVNDLIDNFRIEKIDVLKSDPAFVVYNDLRDVYYNKVNKVYTKLSAQIDSLNSIYLNGLQEFAKDKVFYPDANFTLRLSYGEVRGYKARDAVVYDYFTTIEGIIEKDNPAIYDYAVPEKLKELYDAKDYGRYAKDGSLPVCFIATNHTSGGNSGSPVINKRGELIGVNFDRAWEGVMSDLMFNPDQCRNISVDIRYAFFIIDKFANADYLFDEMTIVE